MSSSLLSWICFKFPSCFGCFLPANTTKKKSLNYIHFTEPFVCNIQNLETCSLRERDETCVAWWLGTYNVEFVAKTVEYALSSGEALLLLRRVSRVRLPVQVAQGNAALWLQYTKLRPRLAKMGLGSRSLETPSLVETPSLLEATYSIRTKKLKCALYIRGCKNVQRAVAHPWTNTAMC